MSNVRDMFGKGEHDKQRRDQVLYFMTQRADTVGVDEIATAFNWSPPEVLRHVAWLRRDGLVRKQGDGLYVAVPRWPPSIEAQMRADLGELSRRVEAMEEAAKELREWLTQRGVHPPSKLADDDDDDDDDDDEPY